MYLVDMCLVLHVLAYCATCNYLCKSKKLFVILLMNILLDDSDYASPFWGRIADNLIFRSPPKMESNHAAKFGNGDKSIFYLDAMIKMFGVPKKKDRNEIRE
ncbi:hypothetical protein C8J56DRAFT_889543 [Mycena floridula]|nr:hypothetical protein C8J56DRAFT_889543 [Mycena floridula]